MLLSGIVQVLHVKKETFLNLTKTKKPKVKIMLTLPIISFAKFFNFTQKTRLLSIPNSIEFSAKAMFFCTTSHAKHSSLFNFQS